MATIIVFASSLFLSILLLILKSIELKYGKANFLLGFIGTFEGKAQKFLETVKFRSLQFIMSIRYIILVRIKELVREFFEKLELSIMHEYQKRQVVLMGRKNIVNRGSVSFYLKKIAEDKKENGQGKIEETLPE